MIIIFTIESDISTFNVIKLLSNYNQRVVRINIDDNTYKFFKISENEIIFRNTISGELINLLDARSCWWRRSGLSYRNFVSEIPDELKVQNFDLSSLIHSDNSLLIKESKDLIDFIYNRVYESCELNIGKPIFNLNKLTVLELAKKNGLKTPPYEIIRSRKLIEDKLKEGKYITKAINNGVYSVIDNHRFYSYTELIEYENCMLNSKKEIEYFPSLIMNLINKKAEIRSFYIEGLFYSMIIFSQSSNQTSIDFRKYNEVFPNKTEPYKLNNDIEKKLTNIFTELKLNSGSVDLIIDEEDNFVFLEINPVGQYGMVSEPCNYNLDNLIAKYLINGEIKQD